MNDHKNANVQSFGQKSAGYANHRPTYPDELFTWIVSHCRERKHAWDCATGNGQAAISIARHFNHVDATDLSAEQVAEGFSASNITYRAAAAEESGFADSRFDLITVAQAVHWFDYKKFWPEVRRVAKKDAFFCAWGYGFVEGEPEISTQLIAPAMELFDPFWARGNRIIMDGYNSQDLEFPFDRIDAPEFAIEVTWTVTQLLDFFRTWSAYKLMQGTPAGRELELLFDEAETKFDKIPLPFRMPICVAAAVIS
ncbi:MAG: methyltransferase domain-containing protein [Kordiimonadaceae bacterium]|nr:methyltransferase domain-containing protein [Kordiimonadaceae bacterium]MBO6569036.1 methyltransferase domain-containing protein [Kordiimonadaceae bacterium]MBO6964511.1 methyltransferase domain-containing protein [Kordiimonadaceae bacterium]